MVKPIHFTNLPAHQGSIRWEKLFPLKYNILQAVFYFDIKMSQQPGSTILYTKQSTTPVYLIYYLVHHPSLVDLLPGLLPGLRVSTNYIGTNFLIELEYVYRSTLSERASTSKIWLVRPIQSHYERNCILLRCRLSTTIELCSGSAWHSAFNSHS